MSRIYLLDINVMLSMAWPNQVHHAATQQWFKNVGAKGFATCPLTQLGFIRLSSDPKLFKPAVTPQSAVALLEEIVGLRGHQFWADDLSAVDALSDLTTLTGHKQVNDAYLLRLAESHDGRIATLDRGLATTAGGLRSALVELVG